MSAPELGYEHRYLPARNGRAAPTLLLLHGTGGDENDLLELGGILMPGAALLSPRGTVLERGMPRFFRRLAEGVFDVEDLVRRTRELAEFIAAAGAKYRFDVDRVIAAGFSNGANIAASLLLLHPGVLRGALLFHPMVPLEPDPLPDLDGAPVFIGAGRLDTMVPREHTERLAMLLRAAGAEVTIFWHSGGHALTTDEVRAARSWLNARAELFGQSSAQAEPGGIEAGGADHPASDHARG